MAVVYLEYQIVNIALIKLSVCGVTLDMGYLVIIQAVYNVWTAVFIVFQTIMGHSVVYCPLLIMD